MVGNAVDPSPQRTAGIVPQETPPQLKMDILAQVTTSLRIGFVSTRKPFERGTVFPHCIPVQILAAFRTRRNGLRSSHTQGSRSKQRFLTNSNEKNGARPQSADSSASSVLDLSGCVLPCRQRFADAPAADGWLKRGTGKTTRPRRPLFPARNLCVRLPAILTHRVTSHLNAVGVVNQPVEDAIGHRRITDLFVPAGHR